MRRIHLGESGTGSRRTITIPSHTPLGKPIQECSVQLRSVYKQTGRLFNPLIRHIRVRFSQSCHSTARHHAQGCSLTTAAACGLGCRSLDCVCTAAHFIWLVFDKELRYKETRLRTSAPSPVLLLMLMRTSDRGESWLFAIGVHFASASHRSTPSIASSLNFRDQVPFVATRINVGSQSVRWDKPPNTDPRLDAGRS